jgi:hypothetical protein
MNAQLQNVASRAFVLGIQCHSEELAAKQP